MSKDFDMDVEEGATLRVILTDKRLKASEKSLWQLHIIIFCVYQPLEVLNKSNFVAVSLQSIYLRKLEPAYRVFRCKL